MNCNDHLLRSRKACTPAGSSHVLHGVDLAIARGQTLGLLGRNGMGKTTLIRSLLGHVTPARAASPSSARMPQAKPHQVARLASAYVPEGRGVFPT